MPVVCLCRILYVALDKSLFCRGRFCAIFLDCSMIGSCKVQLERRWKSVHMEQEKIIGPYCKCDVALKVELPLFIHLYRAFFLSVFDSDSEEMTGNECV